MLTAIRSAFTKIKFTEKSVPFALFAACLISYGLLIPSLGFYMDDWPLVFYAQNRGLESLPEMLWYDSRPFAGWLFIWSFKLLGFRPLNWHIFALILHWITALFFWLLIKSIWTQREKEAASISLLFAIYPFFMLQPFSVAYLNHWIGYIAFILSLLFMVKAFNKPGIAGLLFTAAALGMEATHLFISEYFTGLELIRVLIVWILIARTYDTAPRKLGKGFLNWLPYLVLLIGYTYWRVAIFENAPGVTKNSPVIFLQLFSQPIQAITYLVTVLIKDTTAVLTAGWQQSTDYQLINFTSFYSLSRIIISVGAGILAYLYLSMFQSTKAESDDHWKTSSVLLALTALATAALPYWLIGRSFTESVNLISASRFGLPSTFGAAFIIVLAVNYFVSDPRKRQIFLSILLALSVNFHINNTYQFKISWEKQVRLVQQLTWRAPAITPGTAIMTDEEVLGVMGDYATSFLINTAYQPGDVQTSPPYWYFPFYYTYPNINELLDGRTLEGSKHSMKFTGSSKQMLLLSYNPEMDRCLWVLQPQDANLRLVTEDVQKLSAGSNISLIEQVQAQETTLPEEIFGKTSDQGWCYYFENADLARQFQQWEEVTRLWKEARSAGEQAGNGFEYIPFIEGFAHTGNWSQVRELTLKAESITENIEPSLCIALDRIQDQAPSSSERDGTVKELKSEINCVNYQ